MPFKKIVLAAVFTTLPTLTAYAGTCASALSENANVKVILDCLKAMETELNGRKAPPSAANVKNAIMSDPTAVADLKGKVGPGPTDEQIVTAVSNWLKENPPASAEFPSGAVVAFWFPSLSIPTKCPSGWSPFSDARGRVIIGSGDHSNRDEKGNPLKSYNIGENGGEELTKLSVSQLPSHSHPILRTDRKDGNGNFVNWASMGSPNNKSTGQGTAAVGNNQAHNNMPPYIAAYFCKKD